MRSDEISGDRMRSEAIGGSLGVWGHRMHSEALDGNERQQEEVNGN